ncbi:MAG: hypothetical protein K6F59_04465 [Gammaproteobacteria bacterium]|nr:hypothetical protein [Gammaproteobacteria bacterium]
MKQVVILTGASGSGLSSARYIFEELGYYISEGIPLDNVEAVIDTFCKKDFKTNKFCLIGSVQNAKKVLDIAKRYKELNVRLLLLTCAKKELLRRYTLTRHTNMRSILSGIDLEESIDLDIKDTMELRPDADITIDTTSLSPKEFRREIYLQLDRSTVGDNLTVTFMSFGLKNGIPNAIDTFIDVRSLENPYWVETLRDLNGKDQEVIDYIMAGPGAKEYLDEIVRFVSTQLKGAKKSERVSYNIGIACSGGQHRSTFVAEYLGKYFSKEYKVIVTHRDTPSLNEN